MKLQDLLNSDLTSHFKTGSQLDDFLKKIQKRGIEQLLNAELDNHLGYDKNKPNNSDNARNGYYSKNIKNSFGNTKINVPRDRNSTFNPIVKKGKSMTQGLENVIISLYSKGMSNSDIEQQIKEIYDFDISTSTISRITDSITKDIEIWQNRSLDKQYLISWFDGIVF